MAIIAGTHSEAATLVSSRSEAPRTAPAMSRGAETAEPREPAEALTRVVIEALRALGKSGAPEHANQIAGRAWSVLRGPHPELAQRINALMHGLAKMPSDPARDHPNPTTAKEPLHVRRRA